MNYYPYYNFIPNTITQNFSSSPRLFGRLFKGGINWGTIINNTQKTLNIINQTIPVVKQVSPIVRNAKTMFKVLNEFKRDDKVNLSNNNTKTAIKEETKITNSKSIEEGPTFFV